MSQPPPAPSAANPPAKPPPWRRRHRWLVRILAGLIVLVVVVFVVGEIIFATPLPRRLLVWEVERNLGLKISANSLSTGWMGHTEMRDVTLSLPLADNAFITVPNMTIRHSSLPWLALGGSFAIHAVSIDHPTFRVTQEQQGQWNFQFVAEFLARAAGKSASQEQAAGNQGIPRLPSIDVQDATVIVQDRQGRTCTAGPLSVVGREQGMLVWQYDAQVPGHFQCTGRVAPGGNWPHTATMSLENFGPWLKPWASDLPGNVSIKAQWTGVVSDRISGWLTLQNLTYGSVQTSGQIQIDDQPAATIMRPRGLTISAGGFFLPPATGDGGEIDIDSAMISARRLSLASAGGHMYIDGKYTFADGSATVKAAWNDIALVAGMSHGGDLSADYAVPFPGQMTLKAQLNSNGNVPAGQWSAHIDLDADGQSGKSIEWTISAPLLRWNGSNHLAVNLSGLQASVTSNAAGVQVHEAHLGNLNPVTGSGGYDAASKLWWIAMDGHSWPMPGFPGRNFDVDLNAWGNRQVVNLAQFYIAGNGLMLHAEGQYSFGANRPLSAYLTINESPQVEQAAGDMQPWLLGTLASRLDVEGNMTPLNLDFRGDAVGSGLLVKGRSIGDVDVKLQGDIVVDPELGPCVRLHPSQFTLFDGQWNIDGSWPIKGKWGAMDLDVDKISLGQAAASSKISGRLSGHYVLSLVKPSLAGLDIEQDQKKGPTVVSNLTIGNPAAGGTVVDRIVFQQVHVTNGIVSIGPVLLNRDESGAAGSIEASLRSTLEELANWSVKFDAKSWPYRYAPMNALAVASGHGTIDLDLKKKSADGQVALQADITRNKFSAHLETMADFRRRAVRLSSFKLNALGGTASGQGLIEFDRLSGSQGSLDYSSIDTGQLQNAFPSIKNLSGKVDGSFRLAPNSDKRALGPSQFSIEYRASGGWYNGFDWGNGKVYGFAGPSRLVLDDQPSRRSQFDFCGGTVFFWGRLSRHSGQAYEGIMQIDPRHLSMANIFRAFDPRAKYTPGQIDGHITLLGQLGRGDLATASGTLRLTQADLAAWDPIQLVYRQMNFGHDPANPVGHGILDIGLENRNLDIVTLRYFDRGAEVRATGTIYNVFSLPNSPMYISAAGAAKPFASIKLPWFADIDASLAALQQNTVPVEIRGTVKNYTYHQVPFNSLAESFRQLLLGDVRAKTEAEPECGMFWL